MKNKEFSWKTSDGLSIFAQTWEPETEIQKVINLVHGMGEHSTRYDHWAERFTNQGIAVISFDLRGHGKSEGQRGHSPSYDTLLSDIDLLFAKSTEIYPNLPVFLYGHSLGGNLVLNYALRRNPQLKGVIATSPWLRLTVQPSKILLGFAKMMRSIFPSLSQNTNLDANFISRQANEVEKYKTDPLVHGKISVGMFLGVVEAGIWAIQNAEKLSYNTLIQHGTGDKITSHLASEDFAGKTDKCEINLWQGAYHELHHEDIREDLFQAILKWIEQIN